MPETDDIVLEDPREVNRQITLQMKESRRRRLANRLGVAYWMETAAALAKTHNGDPLRQLVLLHDKHDTRAAIGRARVVSDKTATDRFMCLAGCVSQLRQEGINVQNLIDITPNHVLALVRRWEREGLIYRTIEGKLSHLRRFLTLLGKPEAVPRKDALYAWLSENGITVHENRSSMVATESKSWSSAGVDIAAAVAEIRGKDPLAAILVEMMWAFGLRRQEAYFLTPTTCDEGNRLLIIAGSKGGRPRAVEFSTDPTTAAWQREVLDRAKEIARQHPQRKLAIPGYSAAQMRNYLAGVTVKYGLTKTKAGVTLHGLRHEYAERRFAELSGLPTPAAAGSATAVPVRTFRENEPAVKAARLDVSHQLGHWREGISSAYIGSVPALEKKARRLMERWIDRFEKNPRAMQLLQLAGVSDAWIGGRIGMGLELPEGRAVLLWVRSARAMEKQARPALAASLAHTLQHPVEVVVWESPGVPDDALELRVRPLRERVDEPDGRISGQEAQPGQ